MISERDIKRSSGNLSGRPKKEEGFGIVRKNRGKINHKL